MELLCASLLVLSMVFRGRFWTSDARTSGHERDRKGYGSLFGSVFYCSIKQEGLVGFAIARRPQ